MDLQHHSYLSKAMLAPRKQLLACLLLHFYFGTTTPHTITLSYFSLL